MPMLSSHTHTHTHAHTRYNSTHTLYCDKSVRHGASVYPCRGAARAHAASTIHDMCHMSEDTMCHNTKSSMSHGLESRSLSRLVSRRVYSNNIEQQVQTSHTCTCTCMLTHQHPISIPHPAARRAAQGTRHVQVTLSFEKVLAL